LYLSSSYATYIHSGLYATSNILFVAADPFHTLTSGWQIGQAPFFLVFAPVRCLARNLLTWRILSCGLERTSSMLSETRLQFALPKIWLLNKLQIFFF
jgi:hypothetical protein